MSDAAKLRAANDGMVLELFDVDGRNAAQKSGPEWSRLVNGRTYPANAQGALWFYLQPPRLRTS